MTDSSVFHHKGAADRLYGPDNPPPPPLGPPPSVASNQRGSAAPTTTVTQSEGKKRGNYEQRRARPSKRVRLKLEQEKREAEMRREQEEAPGMALPHNEQKIVLLSLQSSTIKEEKGLSDTALRNSSDTSPADGNEDLVKYSHVKNPYRSNFHSLERSGDTCETPSYGRQNSSGTISRQEASRHHNRPESGQSNSHHASLEESRNQIFEVEDEVDWSDSDLTNVVSSAQPQDTTSCYASRQLGHQFADPAPHPDKPINGQSSLPSDTKKIRQNGGDGVSEHAADHVHGRTNHRPKKGNPCPDTVYDLRGYDGHVSTMQETRRLKKRYINGNGKVPPHLYGSVPEHDLGLCFSTFRTQYSCEQGVKCAWRHHPLSEVERDWIVKNGEEQGRMFLDSLLWSCPQTPVPGSNMQNKF